MKQSKKEWARSLALYGSDFRRWPEEPDKDQQAAIQASDEYLEACRSDAALDGTAWPAPSEALYGRTLEKIRQQDDFATPAMPVLIFIRRPALFFQRYFDGSMSGIHLGNTV